MKILCVTPYVPSPIRVRPYQIVRHLTAAGHNVTIAALTDASPADAAAVAALRAEGVTVHAAPNPRWRAAARALAALPAPIPLWVAWCRSPEMAALVRRLAASGRYDVAHVEHLRAAGFASALGGLPVVFDAVDCLTELRRQMVRLPTAGAASRLLSWEEWAKLRRWEPRALNGFPRVAVTSDADAAALRALGVAAPVTVVPNGVDLEAFCPAAPDAPKRWDLVFSGKLSYAPNADAALFLLTAILPRLDALMPPGAPPVTVCLAGSAPPAALRRAAAEWGGRVTVTGYVEDLGAVLAAARVAVCPLRTAVGIQNKALEAMACGLPVAATPAVARGLLGAEAAGALRVAGDTDALADAVAGWLADPDSAVRAGNAGRAYVTARHRWENAAAAFVRLYEEVLGTAGQAQAV